VIERLSASSRLNAVMSEIMRVKPLLHLATVSPEGKPHSSTVWFAPSDDLFELYWLSSPDKRHSLHIDEYNTNHYSAAQVSGSMEIPQRPSRPPLGLSFEGLAYRLDDPASIAGAVGALSTQRIFFPDELDQYLDPTEESNMSTHAVYAVDVDQWSLFDAATDHYEDRVTLIDYDQTVQSIGS
jgi:hypothetical protein